MVRMALGQQWESPGLKTDSRQGQADGVVDGVDLGVAQIAFCHTCVRRPPGRSPRHVPQAPLPPVASKTSASGEPSPGDVATDRIDRRARPRPPGARSPHGARQGGAVVEVAPQRRIPRGARNGSPTASS